MATPRSTAPGSSTKSASYNPLAANTLPSVPANSSVQYVIAVPRSFKPNRVTDIIFSAALPTGISYGDIVITGAALTGYSANIKLTNSTAGAIVPTAQIIRLVQE